MRQSIRLPLFIVTVLIALTTQVPLCEARAALDRTHRIEKASYRTIGGIDQWVTIRGDDTRKPLLLLVHGGPGDAQSPFVSTYAPYEKDFVLIQWDQRGAGRTFEKVGAEASNLSLERTVEDGIELAQSLHREFPKNKLILLGHSWGSVVASGMATRRPDLFDAYVGTGQVASWANGVYFQFDFLKERMREAGDEKGLSALETIGKPDPLNITQYFTFSRPLRQYMHPADKEWLAGLKERALANGETESDIKFSADGQGYSARAVIQTIIREDLPVTAPHFTIPYCVIQGRHDVSAPTVVAKAYFDQLTAPRKEFLVIEDAGHFALSTHPAEFVQQIRKCLRLR